jgi:hypothetical protein
MKNRTKLNFGSTTHTPMHHCLQIAEITPLIMAFLVQDENRGARGVLPLLKTCKVFYEPALDILWRDLDTMAPLVMCLPGDVWKIKKKLLVNPLISYFIAST